MYKPKRAESAFAPNPNGVATLHLLKDEKVGVIFSEENKNDFAGKRYKVGEWPDYMTPKLVTDGREYYVRLGNDGKTIFSISPQVGVFTGICQGFAAKADTAPAPKEKTGKYGAYLQFTALMEIVDGDPACLGMIVPYFLRYNFGEDEDGNVMYTHWDGDNAIHSPKLDEFLSITGAWADGPIQFTDNILPVLQKRILRQNMKFQFVMKNGWIDSLVELMQPRVTEVSDPAWEDTADETAPWDEDETVATATEVLDWD